MSKDTDSIKWKSKTFVSCNILKMLCGTNCPCGGDAGHGGKTILKLEDEACTDWEIYVNGQLVCECPQTVTLILKGDTENETFIDALKYASKYLTTITNQNTKE